MPEALPTSTQTLRSFALAMLGSVLSPGDRSPEAEYLRSFGKPGTFEACVAAQRDSPLLRLASDLELNRTEIVAVELAVAVETDPMCGRVVARLQSPIGGSRLMLGLLSSALAGLSGDAMNALLNNAAMDSGLLQILNESVPLAEQIVFVPAPLCLALSASAKSASSVSWPGTTADQADAHPIPLPHSAVAEAAKHGRALATGVQRSLVIRSGSPAEARSAAAEVARAAGRRVLFVDNDASGKPASVMPGLSAWLTLQKFAPVFCYEIAPGERKQPPFLPRYEGPVLAVCGPEGSLDMRGETMPGWTLTVPSRDERIRLWETALGDKSLAQNLGSHRHGSGRIAQLGRLARYQSALNGQSAVGMNDILSASWTTEGAGLESLTQPLTHRIPDDALVMTPALRGEMERLLMRCRGRENLSTGLGISATTRYRPGVRALLCGPSGTGKTLAAGWLATQLGLPLYRVDLASVTSKYIGETEKNLAQLLARAEHAEVVLLFDEADSMFGKRTDVKESNDRFANAQTNYLLQRIESFDGIVLLTSNSQSRFDPAFFRRLDSIIEFPAPGPSERRSLWQAHLGADHSLDALEMNRLSASVDLHGGNIRNAVLTAAVLARSEDIPISYAHLLEGLSDEYRKLGRQLPSELKNSR